MACHRRGRLEKHHRDRWELCPLASNSNQSAAISSITRWTPTDPAEVIDPASYDAVSHVTRHGDASFRVGARVRRGPPQNEKSEVIEFERTQAGWDGHA